MNQTLSSALNGVDVPMLVLGLTLVLISLVGLVVLRRRRRSSASSVPVDLTDRIEAIEALEVVADEVVADEPVDAEDPAEDLSDVRALRAQVRVLEEALERAYDQPAEPAAPVEQPGLDSYRAQVRIAVEAVTRRTSADDDPRRVAARVAAAVARLDADGTRRTLLPVSGVAPAPAAPAVPAAPVEERASVPEPAPEVTVPVAEEELVLPVPPPAPVEETRHKRRSKRSAA